METGKHYNYFRDYDAGIGRYIESDPLGLRAGANTYRYVSANPLQVQDPRGLTEADMRSVWRQVLGNFSDLSPSGSPTCGPLPSGVGGSTDWLTGNIEVPQKYCDKPCLSKDEWAQLFWSLFHEGMHSSDSILTRRRDSWGEFFNYITKNHDSIYNRGAWEKEGNGRGVSQPDMWGKGRASPVDIDARYREYRGRTPACCQNN